MTYPLLSCWCSSLNAGHAGRRHDLRNQHLPAGEVASTSVCGGRSVAAPGGGNKTYYIAPPARPVEARKGNSWRNVSDASSIPFPSVPSPSLNPTYRSCRLHRLTLHRGFMTHSADGVYAHRRRQTWKKIARLHRHISASSFIPPTGHRLVAGQGGSMYSLNSVSQFDDGGAT